MISIIVCSVEKSWRDQLQQNIEENIGCEYEFLYLDNTIDKKGICTVYNELAEQAKGEYLCFVHEDVLINTKNWGNILINKASDPTTGVIGFAGSGTVTAFPYWEDKMTSYYYYTQYVKSGKFHSDSTIHNKHTGFKEVIVIDGMFLFCRKDVWANTKFDDNAFKGFHLYDIDFTFASSLKYNNYVCFEVKIAHYSVGNVTQTYFDTLILFYNKWKEKLPHTVYPEIFKENREKYYYRYIKNTVKDMIFRAQLPNAYIYSYLRKIDGFQYKSNYFLVLKYFIKRFFVKPKGN